MHTVGCMNTRKGGNMKKKDLDRDQSEGGISVSSWAHPSASLRPGLASLSFRTMVCLGEHQGPLLRRRHTWLHVLALLLPSSVASQGIPYSLSGSVSPSVKWV